MRVTDLRRGSRPDNREVAEVLADPAYRDGLRALADRLGRDVDGVRAEAAGYLDEMSATHDERAVDAWRKFGRWMLRAHDVFVDDDALARLRELDRRHALVFLPSHRSYLDGWVMLDPLAARSIAQPYTFGGANLNFFPFGAFASRTGMVFVRRKTTDVPVYRFALRSYIAQLVRNRHNLGWSIEGGRTRTGKLRPPMYGILRYVADAVEAVEGPEVYVIPVSIQYDQLHEVALMTTEARGGAKRPEDLRWLITFARLQRQRLGRTYLDFGEPIPLRARLAELRADASAGGHEIERIAVDVMHRINRATPVTTTAVVSLAMLGADRALTLDEVLDTVGPLAAYIQKRDWPVAGAGNLTDRSTIRRALQELVASGVLRVYDGGLEPIWGVGTEQHLVAAFYRNTAIHVVLDRAIGEIALQAAAEGDDNAMDAARAETLRLRNLLKFEFFFSGREAFSERMRSELRLLGGDPEVTHLTAADAEQLLRRAKPLVAHLVLRPYLDAYLIVAERLAAHGAEPFDEPRFLDECVRVGRQLELQHRIASAESVSMELFKTAVRLARHRGLIDGTAPTIEQHRKQFADEVAIASRRANAIAEIARAAI
jgi:glycerol-3-phosphate O-acyltransferase